VVYIEHAQAIPVYVPLHPPAGSESKVTSGNDWTLDLNELDAAITPKTKLLVGQLSTLNLLIFFILANLSPDSEQSVR
jgi:hypothetical protein